MASRTPVRRSTRNRPRTAYTDDAFKGLDILTDATPSSADGSQSEGDGEAVEEGEDCFSDQSNDEHDDPQDSDAFSQDGDYDSNDGRKRPRVRAVRHDAESHPVKLRKKGATKNITITSFRDHMKISNRGNKKERYINLLGPGKEAMIALLQARDKWAMNLTLPLRNMNSVGQGGFGPSPFVSSAERTSESEHLQEWYGSNIVRDLFKEHQQLETLTAPNLISRYLPGEGKEPHKIHLGPWNRQIVKILPVRDVLNVAEVWKEAEIKHPANPPDATQEQKQKSWILNIGDRVNCLEWIPQTKDVGFQNLALSTASTNMMNRDAQPQRHVEPTAAPAFSPSPPTPASIQIWAFPELGGQLEGYMDSSRSPKLHAVICTDWGPVKDFKWCPIALQASAPDHNGLTPLGLLAGIWGDGKVRVINVLHNRDFSSPTQYIHIRKAVFESCPPSTVCSSLSWLSTSHIGAGCANGFVSIWDISAVDSSSLNPRPFFYHQLHQSYILSICSLRPSHPTLLTTTSMDGFTRLTSIHAPDSDFVLGPRTRLGSSSLGWCDASQLVVTAEEHQALRALPVRRLFSMLMIGRTSGASVTCLATAAQHTSILTGTADGCVFAVNPLRKLVLFRGSGFQQTWFRHEWARDPDGATTSRGAASSPASRFTEGYKVTSATFVDDAGEKRIAGGIKLATIYEEESAVTCLAWNPNGACGGWAAAALGSGLLRVEDLALD
ncbi:MAG: hypothetical protein M1825_005970 [Sarcosagium campestre]|nr:MAG: hypothetical protein M1825_005970 [Sarcosagium campestre]